MTYTLRHFPKLRASLVCPFCVGPKLIGALCCWTCMVMFRVHRSLAGVPVLVRAEAEEE